MYQRQENGGGNPLQAPLHIHSFGYIQEREDLI